MGLELPQMPSISNQDLSWRQYGTELSGSNNFSGGEKKTWGLGTKRPLTDSPASSL